MPVVPKLARQVSLDPLSGARLTAAETPESLGARPNDPIASAIAGIGAQSAAFGEQGLGQLVDERRKRVAEETKRADQIAVLNADTQLAQWENARIYDPNRGALTVKGKDAFGLPEQVNDEFTQQADAIDAALTTPEQKMAFRRIRAQRGVDMNGVIYRHTYAETQQYHAAEVDAAIDNSKNAAMANADDPRRVGLEIQRQVDAITSLKLGPEQTQKHTDAATSATLVGVIETQLAQNKVTAAQTYFEETKTQISGEAAVRIEKALKEGAVRQEGQKQSDAIIAGGGTLTQQREKARAIDDADVRDQVMQRVEHEAAVREQVHRQDDENALKAAFNIMDKTPDIRRIPATAWVSFGGAEKNALRTYAEKLAKGEPIETDYSTYYSLMSQAGTDAVAFSTANLLQYRAKLADTEFKQVVDIQLAIRNKAATPAAVGDFQTREHLVNTTLDSYGIETRESKQTPEQKKAIGELYRLLDVRTAAQATLTGKKPTNQDAQAALDQILSTSLDVKGSWWNFWPRSGAFFDAKKPFLGTDGTTITIEDVPQAERTQIEAALRRRGRAVNDVTVLDLFIDQHSRQTK